MKSLINSRDLFPHLDENFFIDNDSFVESYDIEATITDSDRLLHEKLNTEADIIMPVTALGYRMSDIDSINQIEDARLQNILIARLQPTSDIVPGSLLNDEQLVDTVIKRNLSSSEISSYSDEYEYLSNESKRLAAELSSSQIDIAKPEIPLSDE